MFPQVTRPMGSWMGHVRNLDLSDLFLNICHFYMKALLKLKVKFSVFDKNHSRSLFFFSSCFALFCLFMFENWEQINARNRRVILPSNANFNVILATFGNIWRLSKPMNPKPVAIMLVNKINFSVFVKSENWK